MQHAVLHFIRSHVSGFACRNVDVARINDYVCIAIAVSSTARDYPCWVSGVVRDVGSRGDVRD
jgi:hypothetical protein